MKTDVSKKKVAKLLGVDEQEIKSIRFFSGGGLTHSLFIIQVKNKEYEVITSHFYPKKLKDINAKKLVKLFRKHCSKFAKDFPKPEKKKDIIDLIDSDNADIFDKIHKSNQDLEVRVSGLYFRFWSVRDKKVMYIGDEWMFETDECIKISDCSLFDESRHLGHPKVFKEFLISLIPNEFRGTGTGRVFPNHSHPPIPIETGMTNKVLEDMICPVINDDDIWTDTNEFLGRSPLPRVKPDKDIFQARDGRESMPFFSRDVSCVISSPIGVDKKGFCFYLNTPIEPYLTFINYTFFYHEQDFLIDFECWKMETLRHIPNIPEQEFEDYKGFLIGLIPDEFKTK